MKLDLDKYCQLRRIKVFKKGQYEKEKNQNWQNILYCYEKSPCGAIYALFWNLGLSSFKVWYVNDYFTYM